MFPSHRIVARSRCHLRLQASDVEPTHYIRHDDTVITMLLLHCVSLTQPALDVLLFVVDFHPQFVQDCRFDSVIVLPKRQIASHKCQCAGICDKQMWYSQAGDWSSRPVNHGCWPGSQISWAARTLQRESYASPSLIRTLSQTPAPGA